MRVLVTGATGFVGRRLVAALCANTTHDVTVLVRDATSYEPPAGVTVVEGDVLEPGSFEAALADADVAYYLIHAMGASGDFAERDRRAARNFERAATDAGLDPEEWDEETKERVAREIRKRTKPIVIAANKMDRPAAQEYFEAVTADPDYDHLTIVPTSAHAEKALRGADEADVVDYRPGASGFEVVGDPSGEQAAGLEQIREYVDSFGGTGVQDVLESALFDVLGAVAVFPGSANGRADSQGVFRDCFVLPEGSTTADFAYHLHSDIGDGLLHGIDCRSNRQVGSDHELAHRDVVEIVTTN